MQNNSDTDELQPLFSRSETILLLSPAYAFGISVMYFTLPDYPAVTLVFGVATVFVHLWLIGQALIPDRYKSD